MIYNARTKTYLNSKQVTIYSKSFQREENEEKEKKENVKNTNLSKAYKNENRTKEQEQHCREYSIKQTKNRIYDIARSNNWEWFITLTFDRNKNDSSDYDVII